MRAAKWLSIFMLGAFLGACSTGTPKGLRSLVELDEDRVPTFLNEKEVDAYIKAQDDERATIRRNRDASGWKPEDNVIIVTASRAPTVEITNNQVAGVDEGGIVKATTDHIVILRRGRLYVVRHGDDDLTPISSIDAWPPGDKDPDDTWYDEMLLHDGMVVVVGYSYGEEGSEISRFSLSDEGALSYRDTHYLSGGDYFSLSNYASRMVGGKFYTYSPTEFNEDWREGLPFLERRMPDGSRKRVGNTLEPSGMHVAAPLMAAPSPYVDVMHGITACDVLAEQLACKTRTVLGRGSREFYFSDEAAYVWTGNGYSQWWGSVKTPSTAVLYRIPFELEAAVTAVSVQGDPVDQFSFHADEVDGTMYVMTVGEFDFEGSDNIDVTMWESEFAFGETALARIPIESMANGVNALPQQLYQSLPEVEGWVQNRFVGDYLMYGASHWRSRGNQGDLFVVPLEKNWVQRLNIGHHIDRLDRLGSDGVVIGEGDNDTLGFTAINFIHDDYDENVGANLGATYTLPAAEEGEDRSHAFFWRPDVFDPESGDGLMALPVNREVEEYNFDYLGTATQMFYLSREGGQLSPVGVLDSQIDEETLAAVQQMEALEDEDECQASCVDWYGNSRPIFIGDRIFALLGDHLVEGELRDGQIRELRRVIFTR